MQPNTNRADLEFYYMKLGPGNRTADFWLNNKRAAIYHGTTSLEEALEINKTQELHEVKRQQAIQDFHNLLMNYDRIVFVTNYRGRTFFLRPSNSELHLIENEKFEEHDKYLLKALEEENAFLKNGELKSVYKPFDDYFILNRKNKNLQTRPKFVSIEPLAGFENLYVDNASLPQSIATLGCNLHYSTGTCRRITPEDSKGIKLYLESRQTGKNVEIKDRYEILQLLSPYQLETLIFLIFHHAGYHASAWRGGTMGDIDLVVRKGNSVKKSLRGFEEDHNYMIQIKRNYPYDRAFTGTPTWLRSDICFAFISNQPAAENQIMNYYGYEWIFEQIAALDEVRNWLNDSLSEWYDVVL